MRTIAIGDSPWAALPMLALAAIALTLSCAAQSDVPTNYTHFEWEHPADGVLGNFHGQLVHRFRIRSSRCRDMVRWWWTHTLRRQPRTKLSRRQKKSPVRFATSSTRTSTDDGSGGKFH